MYRSSPARITLNTNAITVFFLDAAWVDPGQFAHQSEAKAKRDAMATISRWQCKFNKIQQNLQGGNTKPQREKMGPGERNGQGKGGKFRTK